MTRDFRRADAPSWENRNAGINLLAVPRRLTLVHRASTGRDPFEDVPLLAGRFRLRDDLGTLSSADLDQLWADLYRFRYLASLVVGDNPLARSRFDELRSFGERLETAMGSRPWIDPESDSTARDSRASRRRARSVARLRRSAAGHRGMPCDRTYLDTLSRFSKSCVHLLRRRDATTSSS